MDNDDISAGDAEMEHPHRDHGHQILCLCVWTWSVDNMLLLLIHSSD